MGAGRRSRVVLRALALVGAALVALSLVSSSPAAAQERSFRIVSFVVDAQLNDDASMDVVEHITYEFEGEFTKGARPIPDGTDYDLVEMRVTENGAPVPFSGAPYNLSWDYRARDEQRTFDIAYTVLGAAKIGPDVGELYWKWLGSDHGGVGSLRVTLTVPGDGTDVRIWGHGPLSGEVRREGRLITWDASGGVPAGAFVEGRVAIPTSAFNAIPSGDARLPGILAEEQRLANEANRIRGASAQRTRFLNTASLLLPVLGWVGFWFIWRRWGDDPDRPADVGQYVREPLDDPPAVADALLAWGEVGSRAFGATVVDLAQRGALTITEEKEDRFLLPDKADWRFRKLSIPGDLRPYEREVLDRLFADGDETTQSDLVEWGKDHPTEARSWWNDWKEKVKSEVASRGYLEGGRAAPFGLNLLVAAVIFGVGMLAFFAGALVGFVAILSAVGQAIATVILRRRTAPGARRAAEWEAFKRFLKDFSRLGDAPVGHLILWERYLVYSVALGVSDEVAKGLAMKVPPEQRSNFAPWYGGYAHTGAGLGSFGSFGDTFGSNVASAFAPSSSGSGGGGGFSGGGGGGGGGGGVGAS